MKTTVNEKEDKKIKTFKDKLFLIWKDKRPFKSRLLTAFLLSFAFAYTFFIIGPIGIYLENSKFFVFGLSSFIFIEIIIALSITAVLTAFLSLLKGKVFNVLSAILSGITIAGYIQGNFINVDHGTLDGTEIQWGDFKVMMLLNLVFWAIMIAVPFIVNYFSPKIFKWFLRISSGMLILVQTIVITVLFFTSDFSYNVSGNYLNTDKMYEVSPENNVIVFLLDRFDNIFADTQLEEDPSLEEKLGGFTFYENFTGSYSRTFPSVVRFLTGSDFRYEEESDDFFKRAWDETTFLKDIKKAGYSSKVYTDVEYAIGDASYAKEEVDNVGAPRHKADTAKIVDALCNLSMYRYMPEAAKPYFHMYTGDISYSYVYGNEEKEDVYSIDDVKFFQGLRNKRVSVDEKSKGTFTFYHLQGSHDPFYMDENGNRTSFSNYYTGRYQQTKGDLNAVLEYIEQLKALGVYDKTTIIITADHGRTGTLTELAQSVVNDEKCERVLALFVKEAGADISVPLKRSDKQLCQDDLRPSILEYLGIDHSAYGKSINDIGEDEERERFFYMSGSKVNNSGPRDVNLITYKIVGDANDFSNWEIVSKEEIKHPYYDAGR